VRLASTASPPAWPRRAPALPLTRRACGRHLQERARSATPPTTRLHIGRLTRNVTEAHVREIFGGFGELRSAEVGGPVEARRAAVCVCVWGGGG
jgi:hypothetical protein